tara:strand:+ start:319 stop:501 length:183 start_codon:yes stop_codon:yes gene_type:complete
VTAVEVVVLATVVVAALVLLATVLAAGLLERLLLPQPATKRALRTSREEGRTWIMGILQS